MRAVDWVVLIATLLLIVAYGVWKGRRQPHLEAYLLADRKMRWPTIALSIMATQASAITFLSTPGQAYVDGMRFVQFYLGLPVAMVILSITAVPIFHRLKVFTAYEYLETRFGVGTRTLTALLFLIQRGLSNGITIYAPAVIVSVILGWNIHATNLIIGGLVIIYTTSGGTKAVSWTHVHQLLIALGGMAVALIIAVRSLPVGFADAVRVAGRMGRLNAIDFSFDLTTPYNFWSGMFGGLLVALSYFGTDQSQVQRYLTGASITESRLGLLINGMVKVPMQFFILFVGAMVFVFYQFVALPLAAIFCAAMSSTAAGLNSLASTTVVDVLQRLVWRDRSDHDYVRASKAMTIFWGVFSIAFAEFASRLGSLIEAVNKLGSLFYGTILGIFLLAFYTTEVTGTAVVIGAIIGEAAVAWCAAFTNLAWLWWNVIGCLVGVGAALVIERMLPNELPLPARRGEG